MARWSSGLRLRPLTPATWVRIPYGSPFLYRNALIAQSVEHAAVNRSVTGSSPVWGATETLEKRSVFKGFVIFLADPFFEKIGVKEIFMKKQLSIFMFY